jgi:pyruvate dehydrogenase E2 component (dihydrolipoamide acetyltransferase)
MPTDIKLPSLGENIESGDVLSILVSEGDTVTKDQDLLELETDKATVPIPSPSAGKIVKILVGEGDTVQVGAAFMQIEAANGTVSREAVEQQESSSEPSAPPKKETTASKEKPAKSDTKQHVDLEEQADEEFDMQSDPGDDAPDDDQQPAKKSTPKKSQSSATAAKQKSAPSKSTATKSASAAVDKPGDGQASAAAGPAVRRLARELGVDLRRVRPSGSGGRITEDDVLAYVRSTNEQVRAAAPTGVTPPGTPHTDSYGGVRSEKMSRLRQTIAKNMLASYTSIPQLTNFDDVDITELEDMRQQSKDDYAELGLKLTTMPFLIKAVAASLKLHPIVNASVDLEQNQIIYKEYVNIGVAVDTDRGLVVPVLRDVDRMNFSQIARELDRMVTKVREGDFAVEDLRGGTFTISNLGAIGGTYSTPIINPPEVAILLVGRSRMMPVYIEESFEPRLVMPLSLTYDHRAVDGAAAARFLNEVKDFLSNPGRLLLAP